MPSTERAMIEEQHERYINPYTDFGFKKLFEQAEIAKYSVEVSIRNEVAKFHSYLICNIREIRS